MAMAGPRRLRGGLTEIRQGLWRCLVLVALTGAIPLAVAAVGFGGVAYALSWSAHLSAPHAVRLLADVGEIATGLFWATLVARLVFAVSGRRLSTSARERAARWTGLRLEASYRTTPEVTQMATGFWWSGFEYHRTESEARRRAQHGSRTRDPQVRRDARWSAVAAFTVLPTAAVAPAAICAGVVAAALRDDLLWPGILLVLAGLAAAPFGWRILTPVSRRFLGTRPDAPARQRIEELEAVRANLTRTQAAELERIERSLHDGAQARLVALGMSMGAAERMVDLDPEGAKAILAEARASSASALAELRSLVRGINPPVLAERGLVDAVHELALDVPVKVSVHSVLPGRPERPVEAAVYFAVAELLANVAKHAHAAHVTITLGYSMSERRLAVSVLDDGVGGAAAAPGSGLRGIEQRITTFGGTMEIDSPVGGPTRVSVALPCALS
jgi:signal transduction histidine kinase